jgi:hypothetical protein
MRANRIIVAISLLLPAMFLGCGPNAPNTGGAVTSASQGAQSEGVLRKTPDPQSSETSSLQSRFKVIATRPGSGGLEVDLTGVAVTGDLLTVALRYRTVTDSYNDTEVSFPIDQVSITDDATSRRYGVLKDQSDHYMAAPMSGEDSIKFIVKNGGNFKGFYEVAWFKFPAPPAQAQTISINIPKVAPFDNVGIQR